MLIGGGGETGGRSTSPLDSLCESYGCAWDDRLFARGSRAPENLITLCCILYDII